MRACPLAAKLQVNINECLEVGQNAGKTEFQTSASSLFMSWQQLHGSNSLPGGLLTALKFDSWSQFLRCCHPLLQPVRSDSDGIVACEAWARGRPGQGDDYKSFKHSSRSRPSGSDRWKFERGVKESESEDSKSQARHGHAADADSVLTPATASKSGTRVHSTLAGTRMLETEAQAFMRRSKSLVPINLLQVPINTGKAEKLLSLGKLKGTEDDAFRRVSQSVPRNDSESALALHSGKSKPLPLNHKC